MTVLLTTRPLREGKFEGLVDGVVIVRSRQPIYDGARALLKLSYEPDELLRVRREGKDFDTIVPAPIGELAKWTVWEPDKGKMRLARWKPNSSRVERPQSDVEAVGVGE